MAYEHMTYEFILNRMMERVEAQYPNLDRREGSIIFDALAGAAVELAIAYVELDNAINESFVDTASREFLLRGCTQIGMDITEFEASAGVHLAHFNVTIPIGSRWSCELYNYEAIEYIGLSDGYYAYRMLCEELGTEPNNQIGDLVPITDSPSGLNYAKLVQCLIEGENETSDEDIREAYYIYVNKDATDGNVAQYKKWCTEFDGIGNHKIFPLWNGTGTVKVSILSASNRVATQDLIDEFQEYLDPNTTGMGDGVAPIGAFVTVTTATELPINLSADVKLAEGYFDTTSITTAIDEYLNQLAYEKTVVSYMSIGAVILGVDGVETINNLVINGGNSDVTLGSEEIPVIGSTNWVVV